jgi:hypothetical protein
MRLLPRTAFQCTMLILLVAPAAGAVVTDIPFEQGKDHRIYVEGDQRLATAALLVDTGASAVAVARRIQQDARLVIDDRSENTGSDGSRSSTTARTTSSRSVRCGGQWGP